MNISKFGQKRRDLEKSLTLKERQDIDFVSSQISQMIRLSRIKKGYTQKELADRMGKKQSSISRLEAGKHPPTIAFLNDIAIALDTYLVEPRLHLVEDFYEKEASYVIYSNVEIGETYSKVELSHENEIPSFYRYNLSTLSQ